MIVFPLFSRYNITYYSSESELCQIIFPFLSLYNITNEHLLRGRTL